MISNVLNMELVIERVEFIFGAKKEIILFY